MESECYIARLDPSVLFWIISLRRANRREVRHYVQSI